MRYALEVDDGVDLTTGSSPLPEGAIEPIPNWDEMIALPWYYRKVVEGQVVEKTEQEKAQYHEDNPPTLEELQYIAQQYLDDTDGYIIREYEIGVDVPFNVLNERIQQRVVLGEGL